MKLNKRYQDFLTLKKDFGLKFAVICFFKRIMSFKAYEKCIYNYLNVFFSPVLEKLADKNKSIHSDDMLPMQVWTLWWQGEEEAPELVRKCIESQRKAFTSVNANVTVLTKDNWKQYISLPAHVLEKVENGVITLTHFSDIIRAELLKTYGGIWIDATVFCLKPAKMEYFQNGLFTVKCHDESDYLTLKRWTGFLFGDCKESELFTFMSESFSYYWSIQNALIAYLLIDYIIAIACQHLPRVKEKISNIPVTNVHLWEMLRMLNQPFDLSKWNEIIADTDFLKLSYKDEFNGGRIEKKTATGEMTYWGFMDTYWKEEHANV